METSERIERREETQEDEESTLTVKVSTGLLASGAPFRRADHEAESQEQRAGPRVFGPEEDVPPELAGHFEFLNEVNEEEEKQREFLFRPYGGAHDPLQE